MEQTTRLDDKIMEAYKSHITNLITNFKEQRSFDTMSQVAKDLGYKAAVIREWTSKKATVSFPKYFDLRLRLDGEASSQRDEMQASLEDDLKEHLMDSIEQYRSGVKRKSLREVAEEFGYGQSTIIEIAAGRVTTPPKTAFRILSKTSDDGQNIESVLSQVINIYSLKGTQPALDKSLESDPFDFPYYDDDDEGEVTQPSNPSFNPIDELRRYQPSSTSDQVKLYVVLLEKLGTSVEYFRGADIKERDGLRRVIPNTEKAMSTLMRARQLIRKENNYQEWEEMQKMMPVGGKK